MCQRILARQQFNFALSDGRLCRLGGGTSIGSLGGGSGGGDGASGGLSVGLSSGSLGGSSSSSAGSGGEGSGLTEGGGLTWGGGGGGGSVLSFHWRIAQVARRLKPLSLGERAVGDPPVPLTKKYTL